MIFFFRKNFMAATGQAPVTFTLKCVWLELRSGSKGQGKDVWTWPGLLPLPTVVCKES